MSIPLGHDWRLRPEQSLSLISSEIAQFVPVEITMMKYVKDAAREVFIYSSHRLVIYFRAFHVYLFEYLE
jgi:hypothetical protein